MSTGPDLLRLDSPPPLDVPAFKQQILDRMIREVGRDPSFCSKQDWFYALSLALRERLSTERVISWRRNFTQQAKWVYYLSMELLPGRMLRAFLDAQGLLETCRQALSEFGSEIRIWRDGQADVSLAELFPEPFGGDALGRTRV